MALQQGLRGEINTSLAAVTAVAAGDVFQFHLDHLNQLPTQITWEILLSPAPATLAVSLEGSLDNSNWYILDSYSDVSSTMRHVINKPVFFIRANLTTLTGAGSPAVTVRFTALNF